MCGITGVASIREGLADNGHLVAMRDAMSHRGPDDVGLWWSQNRTVGFGHRRLAIIDLSPGGHQPMADPHGELHLTFNGEIYNYLELRAELEGRGFTFRSSSDTEVLLAAYREWGKDCLARLRGMFALAIFDTRSDELFLARDRAGEKPLFYAQHNGRFLFGSELKALMADPTFPRELNYDALQFYLTYGYVPGDLCILRNVHKLPQGHAMVYDLKRDSIRVWQYWALPERVTDSGADIEQLADELDELLEDAVKHQMIADVSVAVLLSGGVDSSLVTMMAARHSSKPIKTFNVSFGGHGILDEGPYARAVASHFGTDHTELRGEEASIDILPMLARQYDEPMADASIIPTYLVSKAIAEHTKVALGGDGGDELFAGYFHYSWIRGEERLRRLIPRPIRDAAAFAAERMLPIGFRGRTHMIGLSAELARSIAAVNVYFDERTRRRLLAPKAHQLNGHRTPEDYKVSLCKPSDNVVRQATTLDFRTYLVDDILTKVDRAAMLASLEVRAPFLDPRVVEFAYGRVPESMKVNRGEQKLLLKVLLRRHLPKALVDRTKQGFTPPLAAWFRGDFGPFVREILADSKVFDQKVIAELTAGQAKGRSNAHRLLALTLFELWRREYGVSV